MNGPAGKVMSWEQTASGYAAVWATENTREALFDAMQRRETYATTGPRMIVRFFGGWDFEAKDAQSRSPAIAGYMKGVPMGGDLNDAPAGKAPTFLVAALKDPIGANLDRYQIVKGWLTRGRQGRRESLRRRVVRQPHARRQRQGSFGGQHRRRGKRHLDQHHRGAGVDRRVEGPGFRSGAASVLLRARHRNPDAALDGLRRQILQRDDDARRADGRPPSAPIPRRSGTPRPSPDRRVILIRKFLREPLVHLIALGPRTSCVLLGG